MATFYYHRESGYLWPKTTSPTPHEERHLAGDSGFDHWGIIDIDGVMADHALLNHCIIQDGQAGMLPEDVWPENQSEGYE